jgi:hypothetical protein
MSVTITNNGTNNINNYGNGATPVSVLADNLMRRVLRINDPSNPMEVAQGLSRAYPTESAELDEEIQGLPIGLPGPAFMPTMAPSMAGRELAQAQAYIQRDLDFLTGSSQLKEVQVELQSWGETIRTWLADGAAAANQALDASARDRVFSARRILLDYARVSRLVGALTPGMSIPYRRFARSLDEASGLLLVSLGEALAQIGFSGDRQLLQAPASELSARADAAAAALRNLSGSVQDAFSPTAWPWGLDAYRRLLDQLQNAGHGDIRVLLTENGLRAFTDELINRASSVTGDGLRALAATHVVALERLDRLIQVGIPIANDSPPLAAFISALQLFKNTFRGGNAYRLIALGRPLLSSAGLYTYGGADRGTEALLKLVNWRSAIAQLNDSLFGLTLSDVDAQAQFEADTCLYSLDLAVDVYAVAGDPDDEGPIERRAAAYGLFMWQLLTQAADGLNALLNPPGRGPSLLPLGALDANNKPSQSGPTIVLLEYLLTQAISTLGLSGHHQIYSVPEAPVPPNQLPAGFPALTNRQRELLSHELQTMRSRHDGLLPLINAITPGNFDPRSAMEPVGQALNAVRDLITGGQRRRQPDYVAPPLERSVQRIRATLTRPPPPTITGVEPDQAPHNIRRPILVHGLNLDSVREVMFGRVPSPEFRIHNDRLIVAVKPPVGAADHDAVIRVVTDDAISDPADFQQT